MRSKSTSLALLVLSVVLNAACGNDRQRGESERNQGTAVTLVAAALEPNNLGITTKDLREKKNPNGDGTFVFVQETKFFGVERYLIWMVVDSKAYALNGPSKSATPSLPWPREADDAIWSRTGIDMYTGATEVIKIWYCPNLCC